MANNNNRAAVVKVANSERNPRLLKRSVKHLYPLEINYQVTDEVARRDTNTSDEPEETSVPTVTHRPRRLAAMTGETIRRLVNSRK